MDTQISMETVKKTLATIKQNCKMCHTYKTFRPSDEQKKIVLGSLRGLYEHYLSMYDLLRKKDADVSEIKTAFNNKSACLDAVALCQGCDKEVDRVNRQFSIALLKDDE